MQTARRRGATVLYNKLLYNKEVVTLAQPVQELAGPRLPDFECESSTSAEKEEYLSSLLHSQRWLAHRMLTQTSYNLGLHQRLVVLQRIYYALHSKYHDKFRLQLPSQSTDSGAESGPIELASEARLSGGVSKIKSGTDVLIEMGVRTGLSLLFSLLQQNWRYAASVHPESVLCNDVLATASSVLASLPPLSLANESKIPSVGLDCLGQVADFLKKTSVSSGSSGADPTGRRLALELLLGLAMQRGSLKFLLEWVEVALAASMPSSTSDLSSSLLSFQQSPGVGIELIQQTLHQMRQYSIEAGQYCTFSVSADGSVKACGKGSYGRLGLGDSNNQSMPKKLVLEPHRNMKKVSSSKGSDGHTLAITVEGEVKSFD
ncbi:hypothetical protein XENOCAPTIV_027537 [Xenoophorus captivus]|uniref:Hect domain and RLD 7 n=1 Tax=Xenoophorus captivus TaxID=1517983 RepID=A0ABV0QCA0_9TELE